MRPEAMKMCAVNEPGRFLEVCASLMPRDVALDINVDANRDVRTALENFRSAGASDRTIESGVWLFRRLNCFTG